jgi:hypothetical protein
MKSKPNKSTTPRPLRSTDLVRDLIDEAMLCRNETADDVAALLEEAASEIKRLQLLVSTIPSDAITMSALEALNGHHSCTERQTFVRNLVARLQEHEKKWKCRCCGWVKGAPNIEAAKTLHTADVAAEGFSCEGDVKGL